MSWRLRRAARTWQVRPTRYATIFGLILGAMFLASINYQSNAAWLLGLLLFAAGGCSIRHGWRNVAAVRVVAGSPPLVAAEQPVGFTVSVVNATNSEVTSLLVESLDHSPARAIPLLPAHERVAVEIPGGTYPRGVHRITELVVKTQYPLGLFLVRRRVPTEIELLVYPQPQGVDLALAPLSTAVRMGEGAVRSGRQADDFRGLRAWQPGDSSRHIDWKATARSDVGLFTKEWMSSSDGALWLEWAMTPGEPELRLAQLARWTIEAGQRGVVFGLRLPGSECALGSGPDQQNECLRALARWQPPHGAPS